MFELLILVLSLWLLFQAVGLMFRLTWGAAKMTAGILMILAVPLMFVCLVFVGGLVLLLPLALIGIAFTIVKACV